MEIRQTSTQDIDIYNHRYHDIIDLTGDIIWVIFDSKTDNCLDMRYTVYGLETAITRDLYLDSPIARFDVRLFT